MSLFCRKEKVELEAFCMVFYDTNILSPVYGETDVGRVCADIMAQAIKKTDQTSSSIDMEQLVFEMMLIRFEIFALAWMHQLGNKQVARQSAYTMNYLLEKDRNDIWEGLLSYNQAIADSSSMEQTMDTKTGRFSNIFVTKMRMELFAKWVKQGIDPNAAVRVANRIGTDVACKRGFTAAKMALVLCRNLSLQVNVDGKAVIANFIRDLYMGDRGTLKMITIIDPL